MIEMIDTVTFIIEIEKRPCLWNLSEKSYTDKFLKQKSWDEIAEIVYQEWDNFTNESRKDKVKVLQNKWKSIRDYYIREKKRENEEGNGSATRKRHAPYFYLLKFLNRKRHRRTSSSKVTSTKSVNNDSNLSDNAQFVEIHVPFDPIQHLQEPTAKQSSVPSASMKTLATSVSQPSTSKKTMPSRAENTDEMTPFQESLLKKLDDNQNDPNRHFLLSLLPEMSAMTDRQNFQFRMEIMNALNKVIYQVPQHPELFLKTEQP